MANIKHVGKSGEAKYQLGLYLDEETYQKVVAYAEEHDWAVSKAAVKLVRQALA